MLVTLREVLKDAQEKKYGVGLFNTVNLEMAKGVLAAAEELKNEGDLPLYVVTCFSDRDKLLSRVQRTE